MSARLPSFGTLTRFVTSRALEVCSTLVEASIARGLTPFWSCRLGNTGSLRLAEKLGFDVVRHVPFFRLPPQREL